MPALSSDPPLRPRCDAAVGAHVRFRSWAVAATSASRPNGHGAIEVAWVETGAVRYRIGERTIDAIGGDVVLVPWAVEHQTTFVTPSRCGAIWVDRGLVSELGEAFGGVAVDEVHQTSAPAVVSLGQVLAEEMAAASAGHLVAAEALVEAILIRVLRERSLPGKASTTLDPRVRAAVELVRTRFADDLRIDDLARAAGMSRFHFSRLFREHVGSSPYRYLLDLRLARAAELLRGGRHGVTEAAFAVGFHDLGRFARSFRARYGRRPSDRIA